MLPLSDSRGHVYVPKKEIGGYRPNKNKARSRAITFAEPAPNEEVSILQRTIVDCVCSDVLNVVAVCPADGAKFIKPTGYLEAFDVSTVRGTEKFGVEDMPPCMCTSTCVTETEAGVVTMVPLSKFLQFVLPSVQGCPVSMVESAILSACGEFCEKTCIWQQESRITDVYKDTARYAFAPAPGAQVCTALSVRMYGKKLPDTDINTLTMLDPNWALKTGLTPQKYFFDTSYSITLIPMPEEDLMESLKVTVILKPTQTAKMLPSVLYNDWAEVIAAGALRRLLSMRGKVWANEAMVPFYEREYRNGISRAKSKTEKSWSRSTKDMYSEAFYN